VVEQPKVEPLPAETVWQLIDAVPDRYRALIILGAGTGVRIAEAFGLTNDRVDWIRKTVKIDRQLLRVGAGAPVFGPVKDKNNRPRTIPLPDFVVDGLSAHVSEFKLGPEGLIFSQANGRAIPRSTFSDVWRKAAGPLGIAKGDGFHLLRHFYASLLIESGQSVKSVRERLGHRSAVITLDVYGHLWPEGEDLTRTAVDVAFEKLRALTAWLTVSRPIGGTLPLEFQETSRATCRHPTLSRRRRQRIVPAHFGRSWHTLGTPFPPGRDVGDRTSGSTHLLDV
jgi:integrase